MFFGAHSFELPFLVGSQPPGHGCYAHPCSRYCAPIDLHCDGISSPIMRREYFGPERMSSFREGA